MTYSLAAGVTTTSNGGWTTCTLDAHADVANDMIVRNNGGQPMCLESRNYGDDFTVSRSSVTGAPPNYPNIYLGCEYDGAHSGQLCSHEHGTPPRVSTIYKDVSAVRYYYPQRGFSGNTAYDIWFNKSGGTPYGRATGTEIMIWLGSRGLGSPSFTRKVKIDGIWWGYDTWEANHGSRWNYVRYWRLTNETPHSAATLNLLSFFRDAERAGRLSSSWYLTGTEYGFEVYGGGKGARVSNFTDQIIAGPGRYLGGLRHKGK